jgi:hypothetical protein
VLFDLRDDLNGLRSLKALGSNPQGVIDGRKAPLLERRHHHRADDFHHFANVLLSHESSFFGKTVEKSRVEGRRVKEPAFKFLASTSRKTVEKSKVEE